MNGRGEGSFLGFEIIRDVVPFRYSPTTLSDLITTVQDTDRALGHVKLSPCRYPKAEEAVRHSSSACLRVASLTFISLSDSKFDHQDLLVCSI